MEEFDRRELVRRAGAAVLAAGAASALPGPAAGASPVEGRLRELARSLRGDLVTRSSPGYARARRLFNTRFDAVRPLAVAYCETVEDVQKAVRWARRHDVRIAARSGGHSFGGYSTTPGLVVDVTRIARVEPRADGTAAVGAGARLIDVYDRLWRSGVTIPAGSCPTVGVAGLTLGGGVGYSSRRLGLACDSVEALTIVTADGIARTCSESEAGDLLWACRGGGGGNFGIVTGFSFRTHPVSTVATFSVEWPWERAADAVAAWQEWAPDAPDELFSSLALRATAAGDAPRVAAVGQYFGPEAELESLLAPLVATGAPERVRTAGRSYMAAVFLWAACGGHVEACHPAGTPGGAVPRTTFAAKSGYATAPLSGEAVATLVAGVAARAASGSGAVLLDAHGGTINRVPPDATAFVHRNALFSLQYAATWAGQGAQAGSLRWLRDLHRSMRPHVSGSAYQNYIDPDLAGWKDAYYGSNYARLVEVKRRYDRGNLFRFRQSIPTRT